MQAKDLTKEPPRSPNEKLGGYKILARMIDKGRATIARSNGEYKFDCPVDNMLLNFKDIKGDEVRKVLEDGYTDEQVLEWLNSHGTPRGEGEIKECSDQVDPEDYGKRPGKEWFHETCR